LAGIGLPVLTGIGHDRDHRALPRLMGMHGQAVARAEADDADTEVVGQNNQILRLVVRVQCARRAVQGWKGPRSEVVSASVATVRVRASSASACARPASAAATSAGTPKRMRSCRSRFALPS